MLLLIQLLLILILFSILLALYRDERTIKKKIRNIAKLEKYWNGRERRKYVRFDTDIEVIYKEIKNRTPATRGARSIDISSRGMRLLVDKKMSPGTLLDISLKAPQQPLPVKVAGSVVWCNEAKDKEDLRDKKLFHVGLYINEIPETSQDAFGEYIKSLEDERKRNAPPAHTVP